MRTIHGDSMYIHPRYILQWFRQSPHRAINAPIATPTALRSAPDDPTTDPAPLPLVAPPVSSGSSTELVSVSSSSSSSVEVVAEPARVVVGEDPAAVVVPTEPTDVVREVPDAVAVAPEGSVSVSELTVAPACLQLSSYSVAFRVSRGLGGRGTKPETGEGRHTCQVGLGLANDGGGESDRTLEAAVEPVVGALGAETADLAARLPQVRVSPCQKREMQGEMHSRSAC